MSTVTELPKRATADLQQAADKLTRARHVLKAGLVAHEADDGVDIVWVGLVVMDLLESAQAEIDKQR